MTYYLLFSCQSHHNVLSRPETTIKWNNDVRLETLFFFYLDQRISVDPNQAFYVNISQSELVT